MKTILLLSFLFLSNGISASERVINKSDDSEDTAKTEAFWEFGVGVGALSIADYLGSDEQSVYAVPLPYFVYSGDFIKADRKGVRGVIWETDKLEFSLSSKISLPVKSENNKARESMPDLEPLFEIGPALTYELFSSQDKIKNLSFQLPIRMAVSFDNFNIQSQGLVINPALEYTFHSDKWKSSFTLGPVIATSQYQRYLYDVKPEYATESRSFYQAKSGLLAYRMAFSISKRFKNWYVGAFVDYYDLHDAKNLESPLVTTKSNLNAGFLVAWVFGQKGR